MEKKNTIMEDEQIKCFMDKMGVVEIGVPEEYEEEELEDGVPYNMEGEDVNVKTE